MAQKPSILKLLIVVGGSILAIVYLVGLLNTGNVLWFYGSQPQYVPSEVVVLKNGETTTYAPGDPGFDQFTVALDASLSKFSNADLVPIGLSEETLSDYAADGVAIEVYYGQDLEFNLPVRTPNINQLFIPIEGRHAGNSYAFIGSDGKWTMGALVMEQDIELLKVMKLLGYTD